MICVNANGLRTRRKRARLGKLLYALKAGVGIITETHLKEHEAPGLTIRDYNKPAAFCRPEVEGVRTWGGVLILAHTRQTTGTLPKIPGLAPPAKQICEESHL